MARSKAGNRRRTRRPISVVQRLTAGVTAIVAVALVLVGVVLYTAQSAAFETRIDRSLTQEVAEFRDVAKKGVDPKTGTSFSSVDRLLQVFLDQNEPETAETLFAFTTSGKVIYQGHGGDMLRQKDEFRGIVSGLRQDGGTRDVTIGGTHYRLSVVPVTQAGKTAAFAVVHNVNESRDELNAFMRTYLIVGTCAIILVALVSGYIARRLLLPVAKLRATAQSITSGELDRRLEVTGNDDLAELGQTFNEMLDRLEAAFESQRQFLDDAGHELRTPLTILRGHLEVLDSGDVEDVEETRELLLDEISRMARLVDDLLLLAKARRDDFIRREPVYLPELLHDVTAKASGLADRSWKLVRVPDRVVHADGQRITQALLQLASNAVRHTETGGTIEFGADLVDDPEAFEVVTQPMSPPFTPVTGENETRAASPAKGLPAERLSAEALPSAPTPILVDLWVHNDGPDVPESLRETIFQRFSRGDTNELGVGLGLAIVQAIAEASGGSVGVDPADPHHPGATFRLRIPLGEL